MKKIDFSLNPFENIEKICPECVFKPHYPYVFKFDLILNKMNYGELCFVVQKGLDIAELTGDTGALKKLDEIAKNLEGKDRPQIIGLLKFPFSYPLESIGEVSDIFWTSPYQEEFTKNKDFEAMRDLITKTYTPINTQILYEKTGIDIIFG